MNESESAFNAQRKDGKGGAWLSLAPASSIKGGGCCHGTGAAAALEIYSPVPLAFSP